MDEWIGGRNPVLEALRSGRTINKIIVAEGVKKAPLQELFALAREQGVVVQFVHRQKLESLLPDTRHQGVAAAISPREYAELGDVLEGLANKNGPAFLVILEGVEDPHNLGSILRTAEATGVDAVIIPKRRAVGITQTVVKASTGAVEYVPVVRVTNIAQTIETLKKAGIWLIGTDTHGKQLYCEENFQLPLALVMGSEGHGLSRLTQEKVDMSVRMPMTGHITSLNVSVAAGILMYEVFRQRSFKA